MEERHARVGNLAESAVVVLESARAGERVRLMIAERRRIRGDARIPGLDVGEILLQRLDGRRRRVESTQVLMQRAVGGEFLRVGESNGKASGIASAAVVRRMVLDEERMAEEWRLRCRAHGGADARRDFTIGLHPGPTTQVFAVENGFEPVVRIALRAL